MIGTHDNKPISMWANSLVNTHESYLHAKALVADLFPYADNKDDIIVKLTQDSEFLAKIKLVEIFASSAENIQIFFACIFKKFLRIFHICVKKIMCCFKSIIYFL